MKEKNAAKQFAKQRRRHWFKYCDICGAKKITRNGQRICPCMWEVKG